MRTDVGGEGRRGGTAWLAAALPTPDGVDPADGVADSAAEGGQLGRGALHFGHGALEPRLKAGEGSTSLTLQPHLIP